MNEAKKCSEEEMERIANGISNQLKHVSSLISFEKRLIDLASKMDNEESLNDDLSRICLNVDELDEKLNKELSIDDTLNRTLESVNNELNNLSSSIRQEPILERLKNFKW